MCEPGPVPDPLIEPPQPRTQSALKRQDITEAATRLFLDQGFQATSMDEIAAAAKVSKQTVYKQFTDKQQLLYEIVLEIAGRSGQIARTIHSLFDEIVDLETGLTRLAQQFALAVLRPEVLRLRRLVVCEASRFQDLARAYFELAPQRGLDALEAGLSDLAERELLDIDDVTAAANQFAYLILGPTLDRAMFTPQETISEALIIDRADAGVRAFIKAYGRSN
jgi:TetR/AcrR family transcriptional repressor of mexJK operon